MYIQQIKIHKKKYNANNSNNYIIKINNLSDAYFKLWKKYIGLGKLLLLCNKG